jgi:hypothetical protein
MEPITNPFEAIGIDHVSPSNLNCWASSPALWAVRYGIGLRSETSAKMALGKAVEAGLQVVLMGNDIDHAIAHALSVYDLETPVDGGDKEKKLVEPMLGQAIEAMVELEAGSSPPALLQRKLEFILPGVPVPCIGFTDFEWDHTILELKTTQRMPSEPSASHMRQIAFYWKASGHKAPTLLYVTPKAFKVYTPSFEQLAEAYEELCYLGRTLTKTLIVSDSLPTRLLGMYPADFSNFMWDDESKKVAKKIIKEFA